VGAVVYTVMSRPDNDFQDWPVQHVVFAVQVVYGCLSFPFFLFTLPGLQRVLTHSMPTAYDEKGRCRAPKKADEVKRQEKARKKAEEEAKKAAMSESETAEVFDKIKALFGFGI